MYLSHNIVNLLTTISKHELKLKILANRQDWNKFAEESNKLDIKSIASIFEVELDDNEIRQLLNGNQLDIPDFRRHLINNLASVNNFVNSIISNKSLALSASVFLDIHQKLGKNAIESWQLSYRKDTDNISQIYENFQQNIPAEYKNANTDREMTELFENYRELSKLNPYYRASLFSLRVLQLHPFISINTASIALIFKLLLGRAFDANIELPIIITDFLLNQKSDILEILKQTDQGIAEVTWHELYLKSIASKLETLANEYEIQSEVSLNQGGKTLNNKPFLDLNKRQLRILKYLQTIPTVKREDYVQMMNVSAMTAYRDLQELLKHKMIKSTGNGRGTKYMLTTRN